MEIKTGIDFCLLIPCYNNFEGLIVSLKSVVYPKDNYLVVIIDDGSNKIIRAEDIKNIAGDDWPVIVLINEKNTGITQTLNKGLHWIEENTSVRYIARLDCGDTCHPDRFIRQVQYMDNHQDIALTGSWCRFEEKESGQGYTYRTPTEHSSIVREMHFRNVFIHPTVMIQAKGLKQVGYYPCNFEYAEDYALFWKLVKAYPTLIFDEVFVTCDINKKGLSYKNRNRQLIARRKVIRAFGSNIFLTYFALIRLKILFILPKRLTLKLKKMRG